MIIDVRTREEFVKEHVKAFEAMPVYLAKMPYEEFYAVLK